jgi:hypothetical protein
MTREVRDLKLVATPGCVLASQKTKTAMICVNLRGRNSGSPVFCRVKEKKFAEIAGSLYDWSQTNQTR